MHEGAACAGAETAVLMEAEATEEIPTTEPTEVKIK